MRTLFGFILCGTVVLAITGCAEKPAEDVKVPVTTISTQARDLYLDSRDLFEKLRLEDARGKALQALSKDEDFALAHLMVARTAVNAAEFYESLQKAVLLADKVSEGERSMILGLAAGTRGDEEGQLGHYEILVKKYPGDARAHNLLGEYHYERQEWLVAANCFKKATGIDPDFSAPYNNLGYAYRYIKRYVEAEEAFRAYIRLLPDEPNPYDSYAELLMKLGRFGESIEEYRIALEKDPDFVNSFIGIGNNQIYMGEHRAARDTFTRMAEIAENDVQRRQARFWMLVSYLYEGRYEEALSELQAMTALAKEAEDYATVSRDFVLKGNILTAKGDLQAALESFDEAVEQMERSDSPEEVKETARRNSLYEKAKVAIAKGDPKTASELAMRFGRLAKEFKIPAEIRRHHELLGLIALMRKDFDSASLELEQADQQDPRVLYKLALAYKGAGNNSGAMETAEAAANWNGLGVNFAYVRGAAKELVRQLRP